MTYTLCLACTCICIMHYLFKKTKLEPFCHCVIDFVHFDPKVLFQISFLCACCRYSLDEYGTARRTAVVRGLIDALTRGGGYKCLHLTS